MFIPTLNSTDLSDVYISLEHKLHCASSSLSASHLSEFKALLPLKRFLRKIKKPSLSLAQINSELKSYFNLKT